MYRERASRIDGAAVWTTTAAPGEHRVLPDGCMDLIWVGEAILVAGPDTVAHVAEQSAAYTGLRFAPGTAPLVLGVAAHELRDQRVWLDDLWSARAVRHAVDHVRAARSPGHALETIATDRLVDAAPTAGVMTQVAQALRAGTSVSGVARAVGLSARQLHRRSLDAFGYGPKTLARVLRMNRALGLARAGVPFAETAYRAGYADQAHLARDVKELAGVPLSNLASASTG